MLIKIVIGLFIIIVTLSGVALISTLLTCVNIMKEAKSIRVLEQDILMLHKEIDIHKRRINDKVGKEYH